MNFEIILVDASMNWARAKAGKEILAAFKAFHKRAPRKPFVIQIVHPSYQTDGFNYTQEAGAFKPTVIFKSNA